MPNSLVNRSQVPMLKHIPTHCNRECLDLKVTLQFVKMLREALWWWWLEEECHRGEDQERKNL